MRTLECHEKNKYKIIGILKGLKKTKLVESIIKKIIAENFPSLEKDTTVQV